MINNLDLNPVRKFRDLENLSFPSLYVPPSNQKTPFVILLHSLGKNETYPLQFSDIFPPHYFILSVRGPLEWKVDGDESFAWFDIKGPLMENFCNEDDILKSIDYLKKCISFYKEKFPSLDDPILIGFSQGGIVSLTSAVEGILDIKGAYCHCGFYESKLDTGKKNIKVPILMTNGKNDSIIPYSWVSESYEKLYKRCLNFEGFFLPCGHEITKESLYHLLSWINKIS